MLKMFRALKASGDFRRRHLPFVKTLEDVDLIREIGFNDAAGHPISLKQLFTHGIGSVATVQRRLNRLKRLAVVEQVRCSDDRRVVRFRLGAAAQKQYLRWGRELRKYLR